MKRNNKRLKGIPRVGLNKLLKLVNLCTDYSAFEFDGLLIDGDKVNIIKHYLKENPNQKFRTWLIDTGLVLKEL